jgi:RsiW-degrading membrane proteinase PrsW (M82 family)
MLTAMLLHGLWDGSAAIGGDSVFGWIVPIAVAGALISVFVWVYRNARPSPEL